MNWVDLTMEFTIASTHQDLFQYSNQDVLGCLGWYFDGMYFDVVYGIRISEAFVYKYQKFCLLL